MARPKGHKQGELTPRQRLFCKQYGEKNSKTYGNGVRSYIAAGYKDGKGANVSSSKLLTNPIIIKELAKYSLTNSDNIVKNAEIKREYALTTHQELYNRCFADHDNTSCVALLRMYWQGAGLLSERLVVDINDSRKLEGAYQAEAKRIASIITSNGDLPLLTQSGSESDVSGVDESIEAQFAVIPDKVDEDRESTVPSDNNENRYSASVGPGGLSAVSVEFDGGLEAQDIVGGGIKGQAIRAAVDAAVDEVVG